MDVSASELLLAHAKTVEDAQLLIKRRNRKNESPFNLPLERCGSSSSIYFLLDGAN